MSKSTSKRKKSKLETILYYFVRKVVLGLSLVLFGGFVLQAAGIVSIGEYIFPTAAAQSDKIVDRDLNKISPDAANQIKALIAEKENRSLAQQKIDSNLLYQIKMERKEAIAEGVETLRTGLKVNEKGFIDVDITANISDELLERLRKIEAEIFVVLPQYRSITASVPISEIESLAEMNEIIFIQPKQEATTNQQKNPAVQPFQSFLPPVIPFAPTSDRNGRAQKLRQYLTTKLSDNSRPETGSATSEGDTTHQANTARSSYGVNGAGIKIGVLSDGVNTLAARQASGDLPANVTVLSGQAGNGDEGTAMLEIVYDAAPGAQLYFATAFTSITSFAQNIKNLRAAGCDIIIDDISYFNETAFQDGQAANVISSGNAGVVVQAVNDVTVGSQAGALYFSSAANSGNKNDGTSGAWEGNFVDGGATAPPIGAGNRLHDFGGGVTQNALTTGGTVVLKWSDPLGGSANDYDLYVLNSAGTTVNASSTNIQSGTQDPYENAGSRSAGERIVIVKKTAAEARFLHLNTNRGVLTVSTPGVVYGHNGGKNTISVAATPAGPAVYQTVTGPFPNPHSASNSVEIFSSDGPRRIFYNADGSTITPGNVSATGGQLLQKPDITAADGVTTTTPGFSPFFGTSASAPQAGAMMALLKQAKPTATNTQLYNAMTSTAIDIETAGTDRDAGFGIFMPIPALIALGAQPVAFLQTRTITASEAPGNGNGQIEPGETATLNVQLTNTGAANATAISATLTTATAGVTIITPTRAYPNIAPNASANNSTPWQFVLGSGFPCSGTINFTLTVNYSGSTTASQTFNFSVNTAGSFVNAFSQNFDTVTAPALPANWTTAGTGTTLPTPFATTATTPDTAPNAAFTNGSTTVATNSLISPAIALPAGQPNFQLSFRQTRNFEGTAAQAYDGGILELSTDGGTTYNNVTSAAVGGSFTTGGYNCTISNGFSNPLATQAGWCSTQATYQTSTLTLPGTLSGATIRLRWRAGWDSSTALSNPNWRIDTITLSRPAACSAFTPTTTTVVSDAPDPSIVGQTVVVTYSVAPAATGNVVVSDGVDSCTGTIAAGQCTIALNTAGNRTLRAYFQGDATNAASVSAGVPHQVNISATSNLTVTRTDDRNNPTCAVGDCSLREALNTAGSDSAIDIINFNIPANGANCIGANCTITLTSPLAPAADGGLLTTIDGAAGVNTVTLSGNSAVQILNVGSGVNLAVSNLNFTRGSNNGNGAIGNSGTLSLSNSALYNNSAQNGGGIATVSGSTTNLTNVTISGNSAGLSGGGIFHANNAVITAINCTIANNSAQFEGGIVLGSSNSTINIRNTIIAGNTAQVSPDANGNFTSNGYNLIGNASGANGFTMTGDQTGVDAKLAPLGSNGGKTLTHALLDGGATPSPAINTGTATNSPTTDQRGAIRVGMVDKGAFEVNNTPNGGTFVAILPSGSQNSPYQSQLTANNGAFSYSITSGALPNGVSLTTNFAASAVAAPSAIVALSGTPTQTGTFNFAITAANGTNSNTTNYQMQVLAPTAAGASVSGRVLVGNRGLINAFVTLTDQNGKTRTARTSAFGYYHFENVEAGQTCIIAVQSKRFQFSAQIVNVVGSLSELNFYSNGN